MASYIGTAAAVAEAPRHDNEKHELEGVGGEFETVHHYHHRNNSPREGSLNAPTNNQDSRFDDDGRPLMYRDGQIVLLPAPTDDPRDPLNLPTYRKWLAIGFLCFFGAMAAAAELILGAMLPVFVLVYANIDVRWIVVFTTFGGLPQGADPLATLNNLPGAVPIWHIYLLASLPVLMMGAANFFLVPAAIAVGRRSVLLGCGILAIAGCCWAGGSQSLGSHLGARCLQALGAGTVESLIPFIIQDMVFVHQRNTAISIVFAVQGILIVALGIGTPYIIIYASWRWVYFATAAAAGLFLVGVFFFCPETRWHRTKDEMNGIPRAPRQTRSFTSENSTRVASTSGQSRAGDASRSVSEAGDSTSLDKRASAVTKAWKGFLSTTKFVEHDEVANPNDPEYLYRQEQREIRERKVQEKAQRAQRGEYEPRTWAYDLALFHGKMEWRAGWLALIATLRTFFYPHIFFITMLNSGMIAAAFAAGYTVAPALLTAPYSWSFFSLGLCLIPVIIASVCVGIFTGYGADWVANWAARRRGRRVPENQILNLILPTICAIVGSVLFGVAGSNPDDYPWPVFLFALGLMAFGFLGANTIGAVYVLESYPHLAGPALVNIASFRLLIAFVLSFRVSEWIADFGYFKTSMIFLAIMCFFAAFLPVIYIWGPAWRRRWPANWAHSDGMQNF